MNTNETAIYEIEAELRACTYHLVCLLEAASAAEEAGCDDTRSHATDAFAADALERIASLPKRKGDAK